ncbi:MAG: DEAD/DEAH box helicase, partial [Clostridia bacterium]|nr:DEAD/DEAH box helicase [Clostridia bacterium]
MSIITKIFGTYSDHQIKKVMKQVNRIESLGDTYRAMSDAEMRQKTDEFRALLAEGKTLDDILPDAFALTREAADRVLGKRPFKVQLICGIMLHKGAVTEMKTGEGKTLVAVMPSYLNALTGKGVHVVTVNDYLARVGAEEMRRVHEFLGLSTGLILAGQDPEEKKKAYGCDITYGTNNEFGFDYLRDNMAVYESQLVQRGHHFAIVDEVDSILIDEARTPLIISGSGNKSNQLYDMAERLASSMSKLVIKETDKKDTYEDVTQDYI